MAQSNLDLSIQCLKDGANKFNNNQDYESKLKGYDQYKMGVQGLIQYGKGLNNQDQIEQMKSKVNNYLNQLQQMKTHLDNMSKDKQQSQQPQQNQQNKKKEIPKEENEDTQKLQNGLKQAIITEKPNVKFSDVAGLDNAKTALQQAVMLPLQFPDMFTGLRKPWKGILLYGPPGTGKSFLAKACATECNATFFSISSSDLISKWVGESEKLVRELFKMARENKPAIIFVDEIDSLTGKRSDNENDSTSRVKTEFLVQMQGVGKDDEGILVLGATNIPWGLDAAIRRRFEKRIYIHLPCIIARKAMIINQLKGIEHELDDEFINKMAQQTEGFSGSDITVLLKDISYTPVRVLQKQQYFKKIGDKYAVCDQNDPQAQKINLYDMEPNQIIVPKVTVQTAQQILSIAKSSVSPQDLKQQEEFTQEFGQDG